MWWELGWSLLTFPEAPGVYNLLPNSMTDFVCLHHYTTYQTLPTARWQKEKMLSVPFSAGVNWGSVWKGWMIQSQMPLVGQTESGQHQLCLMLRPMKLFRFGPDENRGWKRSQARWTLEGLAELEKILPVVAELCSFPLTCFLPL